MKWQKASRSSANGENCVELARMPESVAARDSKAREGGMLTFPVVAWREFISGVKRGDYDV